jgi:hypothetical protein
LEFHDGNRISMSVDCAPDERRSIQRRRSDSGSLTGVKNQTLRFFLSAPKRKAAPQPLPTIRPEGCSHRF